MKPGPLTYVRAKSVSEAIALLGEGDVDAKILAGGQSLVPMLNLRMAPAERLIDITRIAALKSSEAVGNDVRIGACVTHEQIQVGDVPDPSNGLMPAVAARVAYQAVRNRGTIGGSLALADPSGDWLTTTAALGAIIEWQGPEGVKTCAADEFVTAAYTTRLDMLDVLTCIRVPRLAADARWGTCKLCRKTGEYAHAMAMVIRNGGASRAFLGATEGAPIRLRHTENVLAGLREWQAGLASVLSDAIQADLADSGRQLKDIHIWQSRTCLIRAVQMSFGIPETRIVSP